MIHNRMPIKSRKEEFSDLAYEFNNSQKNEDALSILVFIFSLVSSPDHECISFINSNFMREKLERLKFSVIKLSYEFIVYVNATGEVSLVTLSEESIKLILNEVKRYDRDNAHDGRSQGIRTALLISGKGSIRSYDAYTNIDFDGFTREKVKELLQDSRTWTRQRARLHQAVVDEFFKNIKYVSRKIENSPDLGRGLYCVRGTVASGKSAFVKHYLQNATDSFECDDGAINTDNIKRALIRMTENNSGHNISMYVVHEEGSMLSKRLLTQAIQENLSYFLDKRMHEESDLRELLDDAKKRSLPVTVFHVVTDYVTSATRVLRRTGIYPSDPTPDFDGLYKSYKKIVEGTQSFFDSAMRSTSVKNYYLISSANKKKPLVTILKRNYEVVSAIDFSKAIPCLDRERLEKTVISNDHIDPSYESICIGNDVTRYIGKTLNDALNDHSQRSYTGHASQEAYGLKLTKNMEDTSRSFHGKINVSASSDKKNKMNMNLSEKEVRQSVQSNIQKVFEYVYDNRYLVLHNPSVLKRFINEVARIVNAGLIVDKRHLLRNAENSSKYTYLDTNLVERFYDAFTDELYMRLMDVGSDPIEIAAWVEWNIDFVGHIFSDGCGRVAKLISSWILMRRDFPLPSYANGLDGFLSIRESYRKQFALKKKPTNHAPKDTKEFKTFLRYYEKLFQKNMDFLRIHAAGGLIFNSSGQFLILQSTKNEKQWVVPGGKMEPGETSIDAFKREVFEETNLHVTDIHLLGSRIYTSPKGNRYSFFDYSAVVLDEACILINKESCAYEWVSEDHLHKYIFSNSIRDFFKTYLHSYEKVL